ncbi:Transcription factor MTB1 [Linum perenne]
MVEKGNKAEEVRGVGSRMGVRRRDESEVSGGGEGGGMKSLEKMVEEIRSFLAKSTRIQTVILIPTNFDVVEINSVISVLKSVKLDRSMTSYFSSHLRLNPVQVIVFTTTIATLTVIENKNEKDENSKFEFRVHGED